VGPEVVVVVSAGSWSRSNVGLLLVSSMALAKPTTVKRYCCSLKHARDSWTGGEQRLVVQVGFVVWTCCHVRCVWCCFRKRKLIARRREGGIVESNVVEEVCR
jgi:hypothetical protein